MKIKIKIKMVQDKITNETTENKTKQKPKFTANALKLTEILLPSGFLEVQFGSCKFCLNFCLHRICLRVKQLHQLHSETFQDSGFYSQSTNL